MKYGLSDQVITKIIDVFTKFPEVKEVILYGSRAKGNYKRGSDIDLAIKGKNIKWIQLTSLPNIRAREKKILRFFAETGSFIKGEVWGYDEKKDTFRIIYVKLIDSN